MEIKTYQQSLQSHDGKNCAEFSCVLGLNSEWHRRKSSQRSLARDRTNDHQNRGQLYLTITHSVLTSVKQHHSYHYSRSVCS